MALSSGAGAGQTRRVVGYDGPTRTCTVDPAWACDPDATTRYVLVRDLWACLRPERRNGGRAGRGGGGAREAEDGCRPPADRIGEYVRLVEGDEEVAGASESVGLGDEEGLTLKWVTKGAPSEKKSRQGRNSAAGRGYGAVPESDKERQGPLGRAFASGVLQALAFLVGLGAAAGWCAALFAGEFLQGGSSDSVAGTWHLCLFVAAQLCASSACLAFGIDVPFWLKFGSGVVLTEAGLLGLVLAAPQAPTYAALLAGRLAVACAALMGCGVGLMQHGADHLMCALAASGSGSSLAGWERTGRCCAGLTIFVLWLELAGHGPGSPLALGSARVSVYLFAAIAVVIACAAAFGPASLLSSCPAVARRIGVEGTGHAGGAKGLLPLAAAEILNQFATFAALPFLLVISRPTARPGPFAALALLLFVTSDAAGSCLSSAFATCAGGRSRLRSAAVSLLVGVLGRLVLLALLLHHAGGPGRGVLTWLYLIALGFTGGAAGSALDFATGPADPDDLEDEQEPGGFKFGSEGYDEEGEGSEGLGRASRRKWLMMQTARALGMGLGLSTAVALIEAVAARAV